ncbi:MAG: hypothetical protein ACREKH_20890, partial [Candidatus Rokuibacteriota bacterium]
MTHPRITSLMLSCLVGCSLFGPKATEHRVLTAQPDPNVACACRNAPKRLRFTSVSPVGVALCGSGTAVADP